MSKLTYSVFFFAFLFNIAQLSAQNSFPSNGNASIGDNSYLRASRVFFQGTSALENKWTRGFIGSGVYWNVPGAVWHVNSSPYSDFALFRIENNGVISFFNRETTGSSYTLSDDEMSAFKRFTILNNGNVGIGISNPQARLAVNGNILAKEVKVKTDISVPDYVFEPDYALPTLAEVEAYVREHKHLPEIPSAKDIERDGLDLAEMNLLLLKKMEEMTLYIIEQEQRILQLERKSIQ